MFTGIDSAKEKLSRAEVHIHAIEAAIAEYSASQPHEIIGNSDSEGIAHVTLPPPITISILAGEVVYQIRSALDHLAFDLVKRNPLISTIDPKWQEHCEFPLRSKLKEGQVPPLPYEEFSWCLPGIPPSMFTLIEAAQPYNRNATAFHLRALAELSNIDKHRYLNLTRTRLSHKQTFRTPRYIFSSIQAIDDGTELPPYPSPAPDGSIPLDVERSISAFVTFAEPTLGGAITLPVEDILQGCLHVAGNIILPAFEQSFNNA